MIGQIVGNYQIVEKVGEGGMGAVYKGVDLMLEREVAIKALRPELGNQPHVVERFRSEAITLAKLNHPNIATLYSFLRRGDHFFMVLEYVRGETLNNIIEARGAMTCEYGIPLFCQVLEGIDHAHGFGIIHRDIKPANIMLTDAGALKVLDFGIARVLGSSRVTQAGHLVGTIRYMSPEQIRGLETDARSDIYSLGMLLYEMLTGRLPFVSDSEYELMKAQVEQVPPRPREFAPHIPEDVESAIMCATEKRPDKRFQTAGAFHSAITGKMGGSVFATSIAVPASSAATPFVRSKGPVTHGDPASGDTGGKLASSKSLAPNAEQFVLAVSPSNHLNEARWAPATTAQPPQLPHTSEGPVPLSQAASASLLSLSKLTWRHYAAAGVTVACVLLFLILLPLGIWLAVRGKQEEQPATTNHPAPTQAAQPSSTQGQNVTRQDQGPGLTQPDMRPITLPKDGQQTTGAAPFQPDNTKSSGETRAVSKPVRTVQRNKESAASIAAREQARRRAESLKALDQ